MLQRNPKWSESLCLVGEAMMCMCVSPQTVQDYIMENHSIVIDRKRLKALILQARFMDKPFYDYCRQQAGAKARY